MVALIVLIPLAGCLINLFLGSRLGEARSGTLAVLASAGAFVIALLQWGTLAANGYHAETVTLAEWMRVGELEVPWAFQVDTLSVTMMLVVTGVGTLIHIYAIGYMHADVRHNGDPNRFPRFFVYLNLFLAAMLVLVTANNFAMMFVGWEGVGLCSFLLIGFWYEKGEGGLGNAKAAMKAFVTNRIGDFGLLLAMFMIFWTFGSLTYTEVFERLETVRMMEWVPLTITLLILLGVTGKSAQIPLYVWLPDAMAGPTPVSALIHAATMVTAGIYLMTRTYPLFHLAPITMDVVAWVGAATAIVAATIAVAQNDIKKVLAYSTISQLGFMVAAAGLGAYTAAMFHLVTHAFFKALLFLSSGSVIQAVERGMSGEHHDEPHHIARGHEVKSFNISKHETEHVDPQDMRNMGGLWNRLPVTKWVYLIGALALAGLPPLSGFFSKDEILLDAFQQHNWPIYIILSIAAFFTAFYMTRQMWMVFFGKARTEAAEAATESPAIVTIPLGILAVLSVVAGLFNFPIIEGLNSAEPAFGAWLGHSLEHSAHEPFNWMVAGISSGLALLAIIVAWVLYRSAYNTATDADPLSKLLGPVFRWMRDKWYVDELYGALIVRPYNALTLVTAKAVDLGGIDAIANGIGGLTQDVARGVLGRWQGGYARRYALMMFVGAVIVLSVFLLV